jgi:membrane associated rhomboid family serine protease
MLLPISAGDEKIKPPVVTLALVALNFLIYFLSLTLEGSGLENFYRDFGLTPGYVLSGDYGIWYKTAPFLTSMFVHGSLLHLVGNCLFLYVFGSELENRFGQARYLVFYLLSGIYAGLFYIVCHWQSTIGVIGASGAIAGLMGAVIILLPLARIRIVFVSFFPFFLRIIRVPAYICVGLFFVMQVVFALLDTGSNIAYWAHVGGFVGGFALSVLVLTRPFKHAPARRKRNLLILGRSRPERRSPRHETVLGYIHAITSGIVRSGSFLTIVASVGVFFVILLVNFYVFGASAQRSFWVTVIEFLLFVFPLIYIVFLSRSVHGGLSSFFGSFFSFLYEGRRDHEERPELYRAQSLERREDYLGAIREYRRIFARFPERIDILYRIAEIYRNNVKDMPKAAGSYRALVKYPEEGPYAYCVRHARELLEIIERETLEHPEAVGVEGPETEDG